ncbi:MAG: rhodanese-like domain-containing protein [Burkholderiaceae bacterium]
MKTFADLLADAARRVREIMPWDLAERMARPGAPLLLDVRESAEFAQAHIDGALNVSRGVLEAACEWDYDDTMPALAGARDRAIVVMCRSGQRSLLAADVMQELGFRDVVSLKTGVRGWNDFDQPLVDGTGRVVDGDTAQAVLAPRVRPDQRRPR